LFVKTNITEHFGDRFVPNQVFTDWNIYVFFRRDLRKEAANDREDFEDACLNRPLVFVRR